MIYSKEASIHHNLFATALFSELPFTEQQEQDSDRSVELQEQASDSSFGALICDPETSNLCWGLTVQPADKEPAAP
jgi:hypothetical protein